MNHDEFSACQALPVSRVVTASSFARPVAGEPVASEPVSRWLASWEKSRLA